MKFRLMNGAIIEVSQYDLDLAKLAVEECKEAAPSQWQAAVCLMKEMTGLSFSAAVIAVHRAMGI